MVLQPVNQKECLPGPPYPPGPPWPPGAPDGSWLVGTFSCPGYAEDDVICIQSCFTVYAYMGLRGLQVLRVHLGLLVLQGRVGRLAFQLVDDGVGLGRLRVDGRQLDLQVLLKEDDLIRRPWSKIVCLLSYLGLLVLQDRLDRLGHRAHLRAVRLSVHSRNQEHL